MARHGLVVIGAAAASPNMPRSAIRHVADGHILPVEALAPLLVRLTAEDARAIAQTVVPATG